MTLTRDTGSQLAAKGCCPLKNTRNLQMKLNTHQNAQITNLAAAKSGTGGTLFTTEEMERETTSLEEFGSFHVTAAESNIFPLC